MNGLIILTAYILDLILGDPHRLPHPVRAIGRLIQRFESILRRIARTPRTEKIAGVVVTAVRLIFGTHAELRTVNSELSSPWRIMIRDRKNHTSPNSGYPETAMAGALGILLDGPSTYAGQLSSKPFIGDADCPIAKKHIEKSIQLMYSATLLSVLTTAAVKYFF